MNDDTDAPFTGPDPDEDELVSTRPETDSDIDPDEVYNAGLAKAAEIDQDITNNSEDEELPEGFHLE